MVLGGRPPGRVARSHVIFFLLINNDKYEIIYKDRFISLSIFNNLYN